MAMNSLGLGMVFTGKDQVSPVVGRITNRLHRLSGAQGRLSAANGRFIKQGGRMADSMAVQGNAATGAMLGLGRLSKFLIGGAVAYKAFGVAADSINMAGRFQQQLVATQKIMGATGEELDAMKEKVLDVGLKTKFSPEEIVEGMKNLGSAGLKASEAINTIEPAALLATAGQIGLDDASRAVIGTIRSFQMETSEAGAVADKLTKITQLTNFQATDFANGLSKAAAAGGQFGQSLDETLVLMGSLRNANIDASSSSTAVREVFRRIGSDQQAQKTLTKLGIALDDANGKARSAADIMFELDQKTKGLTDSERNAQIVKVTGARGLLAFNSLTKLQTKVMRDGVEVTLEGAEAFRELTKNIGDAEGTAKDFNEALLDTFEGQKQILGGAIDTLKTLLGEGFEKMLKPAVRFVAESVTSMAKAIKDMPDETKSAITRFAVLLAGVAAVIGVVAFVGAGAAGVIAGVGAALYGVVKLIQSNVLGIGDAFGKAFDKVVLFFKGLTQLIFDGELSGNTMASLMEEENQGVLRVLQNLVQFGHRVVRFFEGLGEGFASMMEALAPTFNALGAAVSELAEAFGFAGGEIGLMTTPSERFAAAGRMIGEALAKVIGWSAKLVTWVLRMHAGFVRAWKFVSQRFEPVWGHLRESFEIFTDAVKDILIAVGIMDEDLDGVSDTASGLGEILGGGLAIAVNMAATGLAVLARIGARVAQAVRAIVKAVIWLNDTWQTFTGWLDLVGTAVKKTLVGDFEGAAAAIKEAFQPIADFFEGVFDGILNIIDKAIVRVASLANKLPGATSIPGVSQLVELGDEARGRLIERNQAQPSAIDIFQNAAGLSGGAAVAEGTQRAREADAQNDKLAKNIASAIAAASSKPGGAGQNVSQVIKLLLDGETIATAIANGQASSAARGFGG